MSRHTGPRALQIGIALLAIWNPRPAHGQAAGGSTQPSPKSETAQDEVTLDEVDVIGRPLPGAVVGDIPPENSLGPRDIRAYGVGTVSELLDELSLLTTSGQSRGDGGPVILVNGRRISGVNEVSDLPTEAILRLDILPEEVAIKYGYSADQKVVNVILRRRFASLTGNAGAGLATEGQDERVRGDGTLTRIRGDDRLNIALSAQSQGSITEADRGIVAATDKPASAPAYRTLQPDRQNYSANMVFAKAIGSSVSASANLTATHAITRSLNGLGEALPDGDASQAPLEPLDQRGENTTIHLGTTLNADLPKSWRLSVIGAYDHGNSRTDSERGSDPSAGLLTDTARSNSDAVDASVLATRKLLKLPAGDTLLSLQAGVHASSTHAETTGARATASRTLTRSSNSAQVSLDLPITRRNVWAGAIGSLTANVSAAATRISGFDTLTSFGYGLNWSPVAAVTVIAAVNEDRRSPSVQQLNSPTLTTVNVPVYDYVTGQSVLATSTTGGNPLLDADDRRTFKLGVTIKPFPVHDFTLTGNYSDSRTRNGIFSLPGITPLVEAAFPDRFVRDEDDNLVSFDVRPVNVAAQERSSLRWGFSLTQVLRAPRVPEFRFGQRPARAQRPPVQETPHPETPPPEKPSPASSPAGEQGDTLNEIVITAQRVQPAQGPPFPGRGFGRRFGDEGGRRGGPGGDGFPGGNFGGPGGGRGGPGGPGRGFALRGPADDGARLQLSVYHTWLFRNEITLRHGLAPINLLDGGTLGGAPPTLHQVQVNGGITDNGLGFRLTGQWRSAEHIVDMTSHTPELRFSSLATADVRVFFDLQQRFRGQTWARGLRATLALQNILNDRQKVIDGTGAVPLAYQPGYLDPAGRTVMLTVRKIL